MTILFQSHSGREKEQGGGPQAAQAGQIAEAAPPEMPDIAVDEQADFGYFVPPLDADANYLPESPQTVADLDALGNLMIDVNLNAETEVTDTDSTMPPVLTYWGQFLDHELTARTDRESQITSIKQPHPPVDSQEVESKFRNARSPRFDLDSIYGGSPVGTNITADMVTVISGLRHPTLINKMRVGTSIGTPENLPDNLDKHRDLPRYVQVQDSVRDAALRVAKASMSPEDSVIFEQDLDQRALIGDTRNDENLVVAQFHLSFLRFHNKVIDFLSDHTTGWIPDFSSAQALTRLHYQWLIVEGYLKGVCDAAVVDRVIKDRASHFFKFRAEFDARKKNSRIGNALPLEFSVAGYRFGHSMVRAFYDYNKNFGRPGDGISDRSTLDQLFQFTGGGESLDTSKRLPSVWVIDWTRFVGVAPHGPSNGLPARVARRIDTTIAPPLKEMVKEGNDPDLDQAMKDVFKSLAKRNLRRGYNLRLPTGQALHRYLKKNGAVHSEPIADVSTIFDSKKDLKTFLKNSQSKLAERTPLWFYILAEAEQAGGNNLGEVGSFLVASTFVGVLLADPDSALSRQFQPDQSPLRMPDNSPIDSIANWMRFAEVMV